jgi:hypothetical protein
MIVSDFGAHILRCVYAKTAKVERRHIRNRYRWRDAHPSQYAGRGRVHHRAYATRGSIQSNAYASAQPAEIVEHPAGCPWHAFCGCGTAVHLLGAPIRSLWLAANWFRFPRAEPAPGMAAVRAHHVFAIERVLGNGLVLAYDPNSGGHRTRRHVISLRGYTVVNPRGGGRWATS